MDEGTEAYCVDSVPVRARGSVHTEEELQYSLNGPVLHLLMDSEGDDLFERSLREIATTEFETTQIAEILEARELDDSTWRIGEAIAEVFLTLNRGCVFPWPFSRDHRNPNAVTAGADLVGFQLCDGTGWVFAFGEVKTSSDDSTPPNVMTGRSGLIRQLETLRDSRYIQDALFRYLALRKGGTQWAAIFDEAAKNFLKDRSSTSLFGVLIRDTAPDRLDLQNRALNLADGCEPHRRIELRAIYLPYDLETIRAMLRG
ncbi:hypothetical protein KF728_09810 [Candidatus Obscuribacterales bacterium]|nr:hypothetical protein [Candidatus Obscuribacterales bacterium]